MGRAYYLTPVYRALESSGQHDLAVQWYNDNKDFYHPMANMDIEQIIFKDPETQKEGHSVE